MVVGSAAVRSLATAAEAQSPPPIPHNQLRGSSASASVEGHTRLCTFVRNGEKWTVYEDLRTRDGNLTFVSASGTARVMPRNGEAVFPEPGPAYLDLELSKIGLSAPDLLADKLLAHGDPDEDEVRRAAPPMDSAAPHGRYYRPRWNTIVGTRECEDTMPVYPAGNTRTYHPIQYFPQLTNECARQRHEGLVGGWMPAVRKVFPGDDGSYFEAITFGDVRAHDRFIVETWHRTVQVRNGAIAKVTYGYSYPAYTRRRQDPQPAAFYRALLEFAEYWDRQLHDVAPLSLPDASWSHMAQHAFARELVVRPGGDYPKYGAVDRDYYGPEYDAFQDTFTMSLYANLECGRFAQARAVLDQYFSQFVNEKGLVDMRGPETAQYGLTLSLLARYYRYTGDAAPLRSFREKISAIASLLEELHDESLRLPAGDPGHGLIHGWAESDSCLMPNPSIWWRPYFGNSAFAVRGWRDLASAWREAGLRAGPDNGQAQAWERRAGQLHARLLESVDASIRRTKQPPYIGPMPGTSLTFRESFQQEHPSPQQWVHRCYAELLQACVLTPEQSGIVIDCMRAYGATTLGVVANVERPHPNGRDILGFISYGYALALLQLDRIEEYLLFLYSHRYHDHSRGSWTAGEVSGITGDDALFCIPAQQTIPLLLRWMLVFEDPDADRLYLGRGLPRRWLAQDKPIGIQQAPTRWGRVDFRVESRGSNQIIATAALSPHRTPPRELQVTFRLPENRTLGSLSVNGEPARPAGRHNDSALFATNGQRHFRVIATMS